MARWSIPVAGLLTLVIAIGLAVLFWPRGGAAAPCDRTALAQSLREQVQRAEAQGMMQFRASMPAACHDADMNGVMAEVTRNWHAMPGGTMMRQPMQAGP